MANSTTILLAESRPLTASDAGALEADISPKALWQPTFVLETDPLVGATVGTSGLAANGDIWNFVVSTPSEIPGVVFYPICMRAIFICTNIANYVSLFETTATYSLYDPTGSYCWDHVTLSTPRLIYQGGSELYTQAASPAMNGFPPRAGVADDPVLANRALCGFQFTIDTWDAAAAAAASVRFDARFLAFPRAVVRSAGFYTPRLFFKLN